MMSDKAAKFDKVIKNSPRTLDVTDFKLYELMKEQIIRDKLDQNNVFIYQYERTIFSLSQMCIGIYLGDESLLWGDYRNCQPLTNIKGVHREEKSERRWRQNHMKSNIKKLFGKSKIQISKDKTTCSRIG